MIKKLIEMGHDSISINQALYKRSLHNTRSTPTTSPSQIVSATEQKEKDTEGILSIYFKAASYEVYEVLDIGYAHKQMVAGYLSKAYTSIVQALNVLPNHQFT